MEQLHVQSANVPVVSQDRWCYPQLCRPYDCHPTECRPDECSPRECRPKNCHPYDCGPRDCKPLDCKPQSKAYDLVESASFHSANVVPVVSQDRACYPDLCRPGECRPGDCRPGCGPDICHPNECHPDECSPNDCRPKNCRPFDCQPRDPVCNPKASRPYDRRLDGGHQLVKSASFAWLEITPSCTLKCKHCYVASMPGLGHGKMRFKDWTRVLDQLHELDCITIQFIGGEPTIHPHFCELVEYAAQLGFGIEVYSNLAGITERMWSLFELHAVHLACSFYSDTPEVHDEITTTTGSFSKTLSNIKKALALGLTLRVGMIDMQEGQRLPEGKVLLQELGVKNIGIDRIRGVGRGGAIAPEDPVAVLCGACANSKCAVTASGEVYPCVFARSFPVGNVLNQSMGEILHDTALVDTRAMFAKVFEER